MEGGKATECFIKQGRVGKHAQVLGTTAARWRPGRT
jgi:hypothetical protein